MFIVLFLSFQLVNLSFLILAPLTLTFFKFYLVFENSYCFNELL